MFKITFVTLSHCVSEKKSLSHWVNVFNKKNVCHTESLCLRKKLSKMVKKCQKLWKTVKKEPFLTVFDSFIPFFHSVSQCLSVTNIILLNTVTQSDKLFISETQWLSAANIIFKHSNLFFSGKFIFRKNLKIWLPFKNKFQHKRKIGLEDFLSSLQLK